MSEAGSANDDTFPGPPSDASSAAPEPQDYASLPWYRKSGVCSGIIVSHLVVGILGRCIPFIGLLGILTTLGVIAVCVSVLTGPVYYDKQRKDGTLKAWSRGNKVAAVILLVLFIGGYVALMWYLVASGQLGGGVRP